MHISEIDTPAIVIDLDVMERNLERAASYARRHSLRMRPHTKTHKIPALGRRQIELGAVGLSVAKTTEAEVMLAAGTPDILVAYPVIGAPKLRRLVDVARQAAVTIAVDDPHVAQLASEAAVAAGVEIGVLAEFDAGTGRVGVKAGEELAGLSRALSEMPGLKWRGVTFYPGHIKDHSAESRAAFERLKALIPRAVGELEAAGLKPEIVSGGSTPLLWESHEIAGMNEIRPGTYIFGDRNTIHSGAYKFEDCAATIVCTVVSAHPDRMMIDGGSKTFSSDRLVTGSDLDFGEILETPGARFHKMNEEHGYVDLTACERRFRTGDRVRVLPNHVCVAMNLHEQVYGVRGGEVAAVWTVEGRGKLQ
jgi:D-serine deaminase-like pyridoxal phosphate-dependent protein